MPLRCPSGTLDLPLQSRWMRAEVSAVNAAQSASSIFANRISAFALIHPFAHLLRSFFLGRVHWTSSVILPVVKLIWHRNPEHFLHTLLTTLSFEMERVLPSVPALVRAGLEFNAVACHSISAVVSIFRAVDCDPSDQTDNPSYLSPATGARLDRSLQERSTRTVLRCSPPMVAINLTAPGSLAYGVYEDLPSVETLLSFPCVIVMAYATRLSVVIR